MPTTVPPDLEMPFDRSKIAAPRARYAIAYLLDVPISTADRFASGALLVVSELVTNVVLHAGTSGALRVWVLAPESSLRIEVSDENITRLPMIRPVPTELSTGFGLRIVNQWCDGWGVDYSPGGKTVWAEITRPDPMHATVDSCNQC